MRKLFAMLFVFMVSVSFAALGAAGDEATPAFALGDYMYIVNEDGNAVITEYSGSDETITIPAVLDGYAVIGIGDRAFSRCGTLLSVHVPEGVQSIGDWAFMDCSMLQSIHLPETLQSIGYEAFQACHALTAINLPDNLLTIDIAAFDGCSSLESVTLPERLQFIGDVAFAGCGSLTLIVVRDSYAHEYVKEEPGSCYQLADGEGPYITLGSMPELAQMVVEVPEMIDIPDIQSVVIQNFLPTDPPSVEVPMNGEIHYYSEADADLLQNEVDPLVKDSAIRITVPSGEDYYLISLADATTHQKRIVIFIYPGETVDAMIPSGEYWLYYTYGQTWYGFDEKFGPEAARSRSEESDLFKKGYRWSYTLYPVSDGKLTTEPVSLEDYPD